jgi:hypothetical protein
MAPRGGAFRSEHAGGKPQKNKGLQIALVIVDDHRRNAARSMLAPTGSSK